MDREKVLENYTRLAPRYDSLVPLWSRAVFFPMERYRREAVAALRAGRGDTVLEIGCGTGANFPYIQARVGPDGRLIALDYTPAMLAQARRRAEREGWRNVEFVQGDAAQVDSLVAGPVDGAISTFCLSIVPGWRQAIAGAAARLRPGGRLVVLDGSVRPRGLLRLLWPLLEWWTRYYGFADPAVDYRPIPWRAALEEHLTNVRYRERYLGAIALCYGEKP